MKKRKLSVVIAIGCLSVLSALFAVLFLQYPLERFLLQDDFARLDSIEQAVEQGTATRDDLSELEQRAGSSNRYIQNNALRVIGRIKAPDFDEVEILSRYLLDSEHVIRRSAILAMKDQGSDALVAIDYIRACMLHDPSQVDVAVFAAQVLGSFGADAEPALDDLREARSRDEVFRDMYDRAIKQIEDDLEKRESN
ncbi:MAG: HEAT repeat domain-containing protein [Planctomycetota bacterium]